LVLEVCIDSVEAARAAEAGGAQRVELCSDLAEGGITPSAGLIDSVRSAVNIPVFVMMRPRGGDFCYSADEFDVMRKDVAIAQSSGADGVVLGLLLPDGTIDVERTRELVGGSRPMQVTFHRAIDLSANLEESLEQVIATGADRVLTSGGKQTAIEGGTVIAQMIANSRQRISVMVCGGLRKANLGEIARVTGASEFHASLRQKTISPVTYRPHRPSLSANGLDEYARYATSADEVRAMRRVLDTLEDPEDSILPLPKLKR
jgi:copper homeostasis protein